MDFTKILFGLARAETESSQQPQLLVEGFLEVPGVIDDVRTGPRCLLLGHKGSGKSAVAQHLRLTAGADQFVRVLSFKELAPGEGELPKVWQDILLLHVLLSLEADEGIHHTAPRDRTAAVEALRAEGLLSPDILRRGGWPRVKMAGLPGVLEFGFDERPATLRTPFLAESLTRLVRGYRGASRHILFVDDLDHVLSTSQPDLASVASLVRDVAELNEAFYESGVPAKIVLLCRPDLFQALPGQLNGVRQDLGHTINWYVNPRRNPTESPLLELLNVRARLADVEISDVFEEFLPRTIGFKPAYPIRQFLVEKTRHTPRDAMMLMRFIQKHARPSGADESAVKQGCSDYSKQYFYQEISDELDGYFQRSQIDAALSVIGSLGPRALMFHFSELTKAGADAGVGNLDWMDLVQKLYECGALGNVVAADRSVSNFKFRNPTMPVDRTQQLMVHKGLWEALNLI